MNFNGMERVDPDTDVIVTIGATGARIVVTLVHEMKRRGATKGLASLCISGGMGLAFAFHRDAS